MPLQGKKYTYAVLYLLISFVAASFALNVLFDVLHDQTEETKRNPFFRRAWVEHVYSAAPKRTGERLIIIISNSQGFGKDVPDSRTYAVLLEQELKKRLGQDVRILNWSVPAGTGYDYVLLGAAANRLMPDTLILVSGPDNFITSRRVQDRGARSGARWSSDSSLLLGHHDVRMYLPEEYISNFYSFNNYIDIGLSRVWRSWHYRHLPVSWLMKFSILQPFEKNSADEEWFYKQERRERTELLKKLIKQKELRSKIKRRRSGRSTPLRDRKLELIDLYLEATEQIKTRKVYVAQPLYSLWGQRRYRAIDTVNYMFERAGFEVWDMTETVPDEYFISVARITEEGHAIVAKQLAERLSP